MKSPMKIGLSMSTVLGFIARRQLVRFGQRFQAALREIRAERYADRRRHFFQQHGEIERDARVRARALRSVGARQVRLVLSSRSSTGVPSARKRLRCCEGWPSTNCEVLCTVCAGTGAFRDGKLGVLQWLFPGDRWFPDQKH